MSQEVNQKEMILKKRMKKQEPEDLNLYEAGKYTKYISPTRAFFTYIDSMELTQKNEIFPEKSKYDSQM